MKLSRTRLLPILALAVLILAWPASGRLARVVVYFAATFDEMATQTGTGPGGSFEPTADVGQFTLSGPLGVFLEIPAPDGDGYMLVDDTGLGAGATATAHLSSTYHGRAVKTEFSIKAGQDSSDLSFRFMDDSDTGIIDVGWGGGGGIDVDGSATGLTYQPGQEYHVTMLFSDPLFGAPRWRLTVEGAEGTASVKGTLAVSGMISLKSVKIMRPAGTPTGVFELDDLFVTAKLVPQIH